MCAGGEQAGGVTKGNLTKKVTFKEEMKGNGRVTRRMYYQFKTLNKRAIIPFNLSNNPIRSYL